MQQEMLGLIKYLGTIAHSRPRRCAHLGWRGGDMRKGERRARKSFATGGAHLQSGGYEGGGARPIDGATGLEKRWNIPSL